MTPEEIEKSILQLKASVAALQMLLHKEDQKLFQQLYQQEFETISSMSIPTPPTQENQRRESHSF